MIKFKTFVKDLYALETSAIAEMIDIMIKNHLKEVILDDLSDFNEDVVVYCFDDDMNAANAIKIVRVILHKSESLLLFEDETGVAYHAENFHLGTMPFIYNAVYNKIYGKNEKKSF